MGVNGEKGARVLTTTEVSRRLRCGDKAVRALIRRGALRAVKVGTGYRVAETALVEFLAGR